jgi:hypothetical protein
MTPCYILVPLTYNDGTRVEGELHDDILDRIWVAFGGYRIEGTRRGAYRRQDTGKKQVEITQRICVTVDGETGIEQLRAMVSDIATILGQETMYFEVARGSTVEFVEPSKKGGKRDE